MLMSDNCHLKKIMQKLYQKFTKMMQIEININP